MTGIVDQPLCQFDEAGRPVALLSRDAARTPVSLVSGDWNLILSAASAGDSSPWLPIPPYPFPLQHALDSGSTPTGYTIDFSADGAAFLGTHSTWAWSSSAGSEMTWDLRFDHPQAKFYKTTVTSGGPINIWRRSA